MYDDVEDGTISRHDANEIAGWVEHAVDHLGAECEENEEVFAALRHIENIIGISYRPRGGK